MHLATIEPQRRSSVIGPFGRCSVFAALVMAIALSSVSIPARASEACTVLLCLAGNWRSIDQCVPPVRRMLRNLALGRSFPICAFASVPTLNLASLPSAHNASGPASSPSDLTALVPTQAAGTQATLRWTDESFCPPQYRTVVEQESTSTTVCSFAGAIEVTLGGQLWNRTWWNLSGDSVTEWTPAARSAVPHAIADDRFDRDYAAWLEIQRRNAELQQQQNPSGMGDGG
jgi:hypothetical protein